MISLEIDEKLAYFIGVLHSDGYVYLFKDKKRKREILRIKLTVSDKSLPMALKFKNILLTKLGREVKLRKDKRKDEYNSHTIETSVNQLSTYFTHWKRNMPTEIKTNINLFGAYLAGQIDGDGHIKIKKSQKDRALPQCHIKISSSRPLEEIAKAISKFFNCKAHYQYDKRNKGVDTCFYVSTKNAQIIKKYVYPHLIIPRKREKLENYFRSKRACPDSNRNFWVSCNS